MIKDVKGSTVEDVNTLNRSCPNLQQGKYDDTKQKLKLRNEELEEKFLISNELLLENGNLGEKNQNKKPR